MTTVPTWRWRARAALATALTALLIVVGLIAPSTAHAAADDRTVSDASLIWGLSGYAQKGIFGPWTFKDLTGNVTNLVGGVSGGSQTEYTPAGFPATSMPPTTPQKTPNAIKLNSGTGKVNTRTGEASIAWTGSYTVNAYPAQFNAPNEIYSDPILTVDANKRGTLSAHFVLGAGIDMSGNPAPAVDLGRVTLVTLSGVAVTPNGFTVTPDYQGTTLDETALGGTQATCGGVWGGWAPEFVYAVPASVRPHFYSTGCGGLQDLKPALPLQVAYTSQSAVPAVTVSKTTNLSRDGETVTITGTGFAPDGAQTLGTRPPLAGKFAGAYVTFGKFAEQWKPSENAPSSARKTGDTKWLVGAENLATIGGAGKGGVIQPDGTFSIQLTVDKDFLTEPFDGNYGIYTYAGGGATYAPFETYTPVTFAPEPTALTFGTVPAGQVTEGGLVTLRAQLESPVPGTVAFSNAGETLGTVVPTSTGLAELVVPSLPVGSHTLRADFTPTDTANFAMSSATTVLTVDAKPVVVKPVAAAGSLTWGFKESFRSYIAGPIAHGSITTHGVGMAGGSFVFRQGAGGTFNGATGTSVYTGSVRFTGHDGALDLSLANPVIRINSASSATLNVNVNGGASTPFANLALASGHRSAAKGAVSFSGIPATLTAQGASVFAHNGSQFYAAGTALDPVSFVIGSAGIPAGTTADGPRTVAAFVAPKDTLPSTPPATTGITLDGASDALEEGGTVTITADGYTPNEKGIKVVIYSDPVILASDAFADAQGSVSWTGRLPAGLTGEHTLTLQGSVSRGIVLDIREKSTAIAPGCVVADAAITWGFKESFRSYISGSIAHGEWVVTDGASYETPDFGWGDGSGGYDADSEEGLLAFLGSVRFTGHGGVLDTTIANPQLRFDGHGAATLLVDVTGTTQDGKAIDQPDVEFVTVDLAAAEDASTVGEYSFADAPTRLTPDGSAAFGTYAAGTEFDPLTVSFSTETGCAQPAVAELESDPVAVAASEPEQGIGWLLWLVVALVLATIAGVVTVMVRRSRLG